MLSKPFLKNNGVRTMLPALVCLLIGTPASYNQRPLSAPTIVRASLMSIRFFLVLVTYLVFVAACFRANNLLAVGLINMLTLAIALSAGLKAWIDPAHRPFWMGFFLFFTGCNALYFVGDGADFFRYTLASAVGLWISGTLSGEVAHMGPVFHLHVWYGFVAQCFLATLFGVCGGILAMASKTDA